jgi:hypothetical protein
VPNPGFSFDKFVYSRDSGDHFVRSSSGTLIATDLEVLMQEAPPPRVESEGSAWPDFVFSSLCSILCTLQALGIAEKTATAFSMNLALSQDLDQKQLNDLLTLIKNVYRTPFDAESSSVEAPPVSSRRASVAYSRENNSLLSAKRRARQRITRTKSL